MALSSAVNQAEVSTNAVALRLASDMREELLTIVREMLEQNTVAGRLAYSPDEAAELLGISRELNTNDADERLAYCCRRRPLAAAAGPPGRARAPDPGSA